MSNGGNQQFRYTQTPSKVLHLRNLPWECVEEELIELCKPFGKIVKTKCNVGANRNQAFVEYAELNQAISMVSYYASSSEPGQIRGKTVYIQYSNRHEIVDNKSPGDNPGNVLLVTMEGVQPGDITIEVIHLVFSAFGFVHKVATFEKAAGFQALIQFSDVDTASAAKDALDGRSIPRYLLPEHVASCHLRISYSAHTDLNIKFQSHRSRDYTNPYLPVNPTAFEGFVQPVVGADGTKRDPESNVLLAAIENMQYVVTPDALHTVFSAFGTVQKVAIFEKNGQTQALVQYPDITTASVAKDALEGHCIYDGGYCKLHLTYSRHTDLNVKAYSDKSRDYTVLPPNMAPPQPTSWSNTQAAGGYPPNGYGPAGTMPPQNVSPNGYGPAGTMPPQNNVASNGYGPAGTMPPQNNVAPSTSSWDPASQAGQGTFVSVPSTFPGQTFTPPSPTQAYASMPMASPPSQPSVLPPGTSQPSYYR